ncbi:MAG: phosphoribosylglycinamide formyltransferase [Bacteroidia bacterium]|nr:phosphoribosylglycinamide formyltransferase [Bacteroidia bacterium]
MLNVPIKIAVFVSGTGTNAIQLVNHFSKHKNIQVALLVTNKSTSGALQIAEYNQLPCLLITNEELNSSSNLLSILRDDEIDFLVLAGFLRKIPDEVIEKYQDKIINIHPSLLPNHGGKGMYGRRVHDAVKKNKDEKTGITIHLVDEKYDNGKILFQKEIKLNGSESVTDIENEIRKLEHKYFPKIVEDYVSKFVFNE